MSAFILLVNYKGALELFGEDIQKMNEIFDGLITFSIEDSDDPRFNNSTLIISYDEENVNRRLKRNAGAKRKYIFEDVRPEDVRKRMKTESAEAIAQSFGISRASLFRKLKEAEEKGFEFLL